MSVRVDAIRAMVEIPAVVEIPATSTHSSHAW